VQIGDQGRDSLVELLHLFAFVRLKQLRVIVPTAQLMVTQETPTSTRRGEEHALAHVVATIAVAQLFVFAVDVEGSLALGDETRSKPC
jgi:hypothetical protein